MPTIKQLEEFTEHFRTIGNEASLTAGRGEPYNALPLPETEPAGNSFAEAEVSAPENLSNDSAHIDAAPIDDFDFGAYLDTLPDDLQEHPNGTDSSNTENIDSADLDNADVDPADLDPFNFDDGLGDLLSGFADDIESVQNEPDIPDDFTEPEFSDPDIPGNAIDADFEELGNLRNLEDSNNLAGMNDFPNSEMGDFNFSEGLNESPNSELENFDNLADSNVSEDSSNIDSAQLDAFDFGNLDNLNFSEDASETANSDFEDLNLSENKTDSAETDFGDLSNLGDFSIPEDVPNSEDSSSSENIDSFDFGDLGNLDDFNLSEETADQAEDHPAINDAGNAEDDFSFDLGSLDADNSDMEMFAEDPPESEIPESTSADDFSGGFDASIPDDSGFDFSMPDMDDDAFGLENPSEDSAITESMDLGGEAGEELSLDVPSFEMPDISEPTDPNAPIEELDAFDSFNLDGEQNAASSFNMPEADFNIDEVAFDDSSDSGFSLAGIDDVFKEKSDSGKPKTQTGSASAEAAPEVEEIQLSPEDLSKLEQTLNSYPLNLRIACEELIAEQAVAPDLMSALIKKLVGGASAKETANLAGKILGKSIPIPKGFLKKTGEELEAEQSTFAYIFVHSFLPILRTFAIFALLLLCLGFLTHQFIYTPIRAEGMYKRGYELIETGDYARANENFADAFGVQRMKKWFFRYAEAFRDNRQYAFAEEKYDQLLRFYPRDKQGALDYAEMETYNLYNYEKANRILRDNILDYSIDDREGLFAQGENFLAWGEIDPEQLENARLAFARLMERYGESDLYLEQMLKYFIRTDNLAQVLPLQNYFLAEDKTKITAPTLAELGGYLLDKKFEETQGVPDENLENIEGMRDVLFRAIDEDASLPESHYHLARYYSRYGSLQEEQIVLDTAINAFDAAPELSAKRLSYRIDAQRRSAWLLTSTKFFVNAQESLIKGIGLYEDALNRRVLSPEPEFGRLYADLADIEYFKDGDYDAALQNYLSAEEAGWSPPEVNYRMGSIYYHTDRMADAMERFFEVSNEMPFNRRLLYTLGNTAYLRGDYYAAQGYFNRLLDVLETERVRATTLLPHDRPEHMELAERIMEAQNNLGVTLGTLADRNGNVNYRTRALALFAESARAWDFITRNPTTMVRLFVPGTEIPETNQSLLNTKYTLYPEPGFEPLIYNQIDLDVEDPSTWEYLVPPDNLSRDIPYEIRNQD